jgi:hypothetical protein
MGIANGAQSVTLDLSRHKPLLHLPEVIHAENRFAQSNTLNICYQFIGTHATDLALL